MTTTLTLAQKQHLYREGFVILEGVVPSSVIDAARARIAAAQPGESLSGAREMTDIVNATSLTSILREAVGPFDPPSDCQVAITQVAPQGTRFASNGYRECDLPYWGARMHMDGNITMAAPQEVQQGSPEEIYARYIASGPSGDLGRSPMVIGHNGTPLFQDPAMTLGLGSFTAFVFAALNDQLIDGCGQTMVVPRGHHAMERFFRWQRSVNNHLGPEGPGWPRLDHAAPNRSGMMYLPPAIQEELIGDDAEATPDGRKWARPIPVRLRAGDVCIAMYNLPHSASFNATGTESRKQIIFRIRNKKRQPSIVVTGRSDHPDRGWKGEWLEYPPGNDPWERSKDAMCDMWSEWDGMREVVAAESAKKDL